MTLRILHILAPADFGGLERVVHGLAVGQRERGHDVRVLAVLDRGREENHPLVRELTRAGVEVEAVALRPRAYRAERRSISTALTRSRPHVVHTHGARVDVLDAPVARRAGFATVTTVHGFTGGGAKNRLYEVLQRRSMRSADAVVAVSAGLATELIASGIPPERVRTVPNAWAGNGGSLCRDAARALLGVAEATGPVVGWVGRLTHEKGADLFLRALARVGVSGTHAVVVGTGRERASLETLAARLGIRDRVRWAGPVERADRILSAFDVFVMSSRTEGTPIVLFEAMAAGVPVVATSVGGIPDVVSPAEALLVSPEDPEMLADAIGRTIAEPDAARKRVASARKRLASDFARGPWLDRYESIYREACSAR